MTQLPLTILLSGSNIPDKDDTNTDPDTDTNKEEDKEDSGNNSEYELSECAKNTRDCNLDTDCKKVEFMLFNLFCFVIERAHQVLDIHKNDPITPRCSSFNSKFPRTCFKYDI